MDGKRFLADLANNLNRPVVFDAIMRVRTSTGVRPVEFFGSFFMANTTDTELASLNSDSAIACKNITGIFRWNRFDAKYYLNFT